MNRIDVEGFSEISKGLAEALKYGCKGRSRTHFPPCFVGGTANWTFGGSIALRPSYIKKHFDCNFLLQKATYIIYN